MRHSCVMYVVNYILGKDRLPTKWFGYIVGELGSD